MELFKSDFVSNPTKYQSLQELVNIKKLFGVHFFPLSSIYLSKLVIDTCFLGQLSACGVTHGSRNGLETTLFQKFLRRWVIGTDISRSAPFFDLIQHDMHEELPAEIAPLLSLGFVFSNSWDHTYDPFLLFQTWLKSMHPRSVLIIEKQYSSGRVATISDPCSLSETEIIDIITQIQPDHDEAPAVYCGKLQLNYFPLSAYDGQFGVYSGTATCLTQIDSNYLALTDFSGNLRPLNHLIFVRSCSSSHIARVKQVVHSINSAMNSKDLLISQSLFCMDPKFPSQRINIIDDILKPVLSRILLANSLQEKVFNSATSDRSDAGEIEDHLSL